MVTLAVGLALLGAAGAVVAQADTVTPIPNQILARLSCANPADQQCIVIAGSQSATGPAEFNRLLPISGSSAGTPIQLPAGFSASDLACSSGTSCVVVGQQMTGGAQPSGQYVPPQYQTAIISVTNGTVGSPQDVPGSYVALNAVACSGAGRCVAVGSNSYVGGGGQTAVVVPITNGVPGAMQTVAGAASLTGVTCSDSNLCVAVGRPGASGGGVVVPITGGTAGSAQPVAGVSGNDYLAAVACAPGTTRCLATGQGVVVPISNGVSGAAVSVQAGPAGSQYPAQFTSISCPNTSGCLAVGALRPTSQGGSPSGLILPVGLDGTLGTMRTEPGTEGFSGIECGDLSDCIALGYTPSATYAIVQIHGAPTSPSTAVSQGLRVSGPASSLSAILHAGGYPAPFTAPAAGKAQISWYYLAAGAHLARVTRPVLVARGSKQFTGPGKAKIKVALTNKGRSLLKKAKRIKLTAQGSFTPQSGKSTTKRKVITLK